MNHYELIDWVDYARGLLDPVRQASMHHHLSSACGQCNHAAGMFRKVARAAEADARYRVPESEVHCAKAIFVLQQPERVQVLPGIVSQLIYDSFREPLPAGMRAQHRISRQTVYTAGDYHLDLWMEHERGSARVILVGQVADRKEPTRAMGNIPVVLLSRNKVIAHAISNDFGEFHLDYTPQRHLRLCVPVRGRNSANHHPQF